MLGHDLPPFFRIMLKFDRHGVPDESHRGPSLVMFYPFPELQPVMSCFPELVGSMLHLLQVTPGDAEENKENAGENGEIPSWIFDYDRCPKFWSAKNHTGVHMCYYVLLFDIVFC